MALHAPTSMNASLVLITVMPMPFVPTKMDLSLVHATVATPVTGSPALTLMSVSMDLIIAIAMLLVQTKPDLLRVSVTVDSLEVELYAPTSMNASLVLTTVMPTPLAPIRSVLLAAPARQATLAMVSPVSNWQCYFLARRGQGMSSKHAK